MIKTDENALICDLAETYSIYDYKQLPANRVAVFSCGLRETSRIKMLMSGQKVPLETLLMAKIADTLSILLWSKTKDGEKNRNRPKQILNDILGLSEEKDDIQSFMSGKEFEQRRKELIGGEKNGN